MKKRNKTLLLAYSMTIGTLALALLVLGLLMSVNMWPIYFICFMAIYAMIIIDIAVRAKNEPPVN